MKLKFACVLLYSLCNSLICFCQKNFDGSWTDGGQFFSIFSLPGGEIQFEGGTLHEGGSAFYCEILSETKIKILGGRPKEDDFPGYGEIHCTLEYKKINGFEVLITKDSNNVFKGFLVKMLPGGNFEEFIIKNKINFQLMGKYVIAGSRDTIVFFPGEKKVSWNGKNKNYKFETEYDTPIDVITIAAKTYFYERKFKTLFLYAAKKKDDDEFEEGKLLQKLVLVEATPLYPAGLYGDYAFASAIPLTDDILEFYSADELKLMRNEIFARHGYIFTNPEIRKYFEDRPWYKPLMQDVSDKFSEIERLNMEQIIRIETERKVAK